MLPLLLSSLTSEASEWSREEVEKVRAAVLRRMQTVAEMPSNLEGHILGEFSRSPTDWKEAFGMFRGSAFGLAHNLPVSKSYHHCHLHSLLFVYMCCIEITATLCAAASHQTPSQPESISRGCVNATWKRGSVGHDWCQANSRCGS